MNPAEELTELVAHGTALSERYTSAEAVSRARERFTRAPSLNLLEGTPLIAYPNRPSLPTPGVVAPSRRRPRVAIATPDFVGPIRNGGIGTAYTALAQTLASAGHDVTVLFTLGNHCENGRIEDWIEHYRVRHISFVPVPEPEGPALFNGPRASFAAYRWLSKQIFDVIHFPEWGGTAFCSVQAKRLGLAFADAVLCVGVHSPTVWHDLEDCRTIDRLEQLERDFLERRSVELADVVISPSQYLLQWLDQWGWITPVQTYVFPYISQERLRAPAPTRLVAVRELVFFGRLESRKGLTLFCDAIDRLIAERRLGDSTVTFLGKRGSVAGSDSLEYLAERASKWNHEWRAIVDLGRDEAIDYLVSKRALAVMPSLADNTPNTVLECLSFGVPFVATNVGGIPEMIGELDRGSALVSPEPDALARALAERLEHGAATIRSSVNQEDVRKDWIAWHVAQANRHPHGPVKSADSVTARPLVTVCMATHERPEFLAQALDSLRSQTYSPLEVVLVDDGSESVAAREALDRLEPEFSSRQWKLSRQPRRFPGAARNVAATMARGRYLLFMDDDNVARPEEIEVLVQAAEASGVPVLTCSHDAFRGTSPPEASTSASHRWMPLGGALPLGLFVNCIGDTNMLIRREAFFEAGGFDEERGAGLFEDWAFFLKAMVRGIRVETVPEPLYWYRLGAHGFGQRSPAHESYSRPITPLARIMPSGVALALFFAAGLWRRSTAASAPQDTIPAPPAIAPPSPMRVPILEWIAARLQPNVPDAEDEDHLAARFDSAPVGQRFGSDLLPLVPLNQVEVTATPEGCRLRSLGHDPQVVLPMNPVPLRRKEPLLIRIELSSPRNSTAQFFWKTARLPVYCERQSVRTTIAPGRNVRFVLIPAKTIGNLRFDPAAHEGTFDLHSLEIRVER